MITMKLHAFTQKKANKAVIYGSLLFYTHIYLYI